ncbi:MAG: tetratricopeptide repeat protein [Rhizobiaceae bacterium]
MRKTHFTASLAMLAALVVSGCQTGMVNSLDTAVHGVKVADISAGDLNQGKAQFRDANYGLAEKHFRKAVELRADNAEAWMGLAASYDQLGRFDFADRAYDQLLRLAGREPRVVNNLGYSQLLRGNRKKARQLFEEARRNAPNDKVIVANIELLDKL